MAKKNRLTVNFSGFEEIVEKLDKLNADVKVTTEKALIKSFDYVTPQAEAAIKQHKLTGETEKTLVKRANVVWAGGKASVKVGFDISKGGLPSIFLMYGTPRITPDRKLYNAFYGTATKKKVREIQEEIFTKELQRLNR